MNPRRVLIVGGGTAAWMTAVHLNAVLNRGGRRVADIGIIETEDRPSAGIAETTLPEMHRFLAIIGVNPAEFLRRVGGTLKQGTKFVNWLHEGEHAFYHPFDLRRPGTVDRSAEEWLKSDRSIAFAETVSLQPALCEANLAPLMLGQWDFGEPISCAFHVDEARFVEFLAGMAVTRGVQHARDSLAGIARAENGDIAAVQTAGGLRLEADIVIDCTGPAAVVSEHEMGVRWVDCSKWLPCNRSLSINVPYEQLYPGQVHPYTTATAMSAGWLQEIPLLDRRELRYFYSSDFMSDDEARQELLDVEGDHAAANPSNVAQHATGHRENAWVRNCISIGAAGSSIEPLESTNLYMIGLAADMLVEHFPLAGNMEALAFRYNRIMVNRFYEALDLVNLHYALSRRQDSDFWRAMSQPERTTNRLKAKIDYWRVKPPTLTDFQDPFFPGQPDTKLPASDQPGDYRSPVDTAVLWNHENYEAILYGMDFLSDECDDWYGKERPATNIGQHIAERQQMAPQKLPTHEQWLQQVLGMPDYGRRS